MTLLTVYFRLFHLQLHLIFFLFYETFFLLPVFFIFIKGNIPPNLEYPDRPYCLDGYYLLGTFRNDKFHLVLLENIAQCLNHSVFAPPFHGSQCMASLLHNRCFLSRTTGVSGYGTPILSTPTKKLLCVHPMVADKT